MTKTKRRYWDSSAKYVLLLPSIAVFIILSFFPLIYSFIYSLSDWNMSSPNPPRFVGLNNYIKMFSDYNFWVSLKVTFLFIAGVIIGELILGLILALLLNREFKGKSFIRTIFIMPVMITPVVVGIIWRLLYNPDMGVLNYIFGFIGISPKIWLGTASSALISVIFTDIWEWTPMVALIILSGLHSIPTDPIEAGKIDGASPFQVFRYIIFPLLKPTFLVALIIRTIDAFKIFDVIYVLTGGGPGMGTEVLSIYSYRQGFRFFKMGYASATTILMIGIIAIICVFYMKSIRQLEY